MPYKDPERQRRASRESAARRREQMREGAKKYRRRLRDIVNQAKSKPCADCGVAYPPYVMDLDHRQGTDKVFEVSRMVIHYGEAKLRAEIEKCEAVCANCHRERTHGECQRDVVYR